jgi:hypothetical protein
MPPDVALGLMLNLTTANGWKTLPIVQGVGLAFSNKPHMAGFMSTLLGRSPSIKEQISAHFTMQPEQRSNAWQSA